MLNLGNEAIEALRSLDQTLQGYAIRNALAEQMRRAMNAALDTPENHLIAVGYARAMRDLFVAVEAASLGVSLNRVEKPGPMPNSRGRPPGGKPAYVE